MHAPRVLGTPDTNAQLFDATLGHSATHGFGYWVACDRDSGMPLGWVGVQRRDAALNLYYRFVIEAQGRGLAREAARAAVALATERHPDLVVRALVKDHNKASVRTAESAGLVRAGAPRERVAGALATHETQMAGGDAVAGALREPDGRLVGWAWWVRVPNPLLHHGRWLCRVMVDPARQRRGLGRLLMAGMHRLAREDGVELLQLGVRSGSGASAFYAQCGYTEVGRIPGAIRVAPGDDRDDVTMARRVDGRPLVAHGGS